MCRIVLNIYVITALRTNKNDETLSGADTVF